MSFAASTLLTLSSAWLYGRSFPTASVHWLAWFALVPFLLAIRTATLARALVLGWIWTVAAAYGVGDWFVQSITRYYLQPTLVGVGLFIGVSSLMAAPYYMAFAACYRVLVRRPGPALPLLVAAAWVAAELGRARMLGGNPWALAGYSQIGVDPLQQIADVTGVYGITFALVAVNAATAELVGWVLTARRARVAAARGAVLGGMTAVAAVVAMILAYGHSRLRAPLTDPAAADGDAFTVAAVQGNLDVGSQWREELYGQNFDAYARLTMDALRNAKADLVFWPENALTFFLADEALYRRAIGYVLAPSGAQLVVGGPYAARPSEGIYYNSVFLLAPDGSIVARYDKQRLVPFAEYFPLRALGALSRRFARVRELTPGSSDAPLPTKVGPAGVTICSEAMFPEIAAARARAGAVFFVDPANDTWLTPKFSAQQFDIVRLRTIEQRRYLVRASTSGPSAIVDPFGRVVVRTEFLTSGAITGTVHPLRVVTVYGRIGDLFAVLCAAAAVVGWVRAVRTRVGPRVARGEVSKPVRAA
jgi:apolipoprotein N-acyltransferase